MELLKRLNCTNFKDITIMIIFLNNNNTLYLYLFIILVICLFFNMKIQEYTSY